MGRHTILNPKTGRRVLKTGAIGRKVSKAKKTVVKGSKDKKKKNVTKTVTSKNKKQSGPCLSGTCLPGVRLKKSAAGAVRPSARDLYDLGLTGPVVYGGKVHKMCFRSDGTPYWKELKDAELSSVHLSRLHFFA